LQALPGTPFSLARQRAYDPEVGRFTSADPIGLAGGDNRFGYATGDPLGFVDPEGFMAVEPSMNLVRSFTLPGVGTGAAGFDQSAPSADVVGPQYGDEAAWNATVWTRPSLGQQQDPSQDESSEVDFPAVLVSERAGSAEVDAVWAVFIEAGSPTMRLAEASMRVDRAVRAGLYREHLKGETGRRQQWLADGSKKASGEAGLVARLVDGAVKGDRAEESGIPELIGSTGSDLFLSAADSFPNPWVSVPAYVGGVVRDASDAGAAYDDFQQDPSWVNGADVLLQLASTATGVFPGPGELPAELGSAVVRAAKNDGVQEAAGEAAEQFITLYRGVTKGHPGYDEATAGMAFPRGGHADPESHNIGDTESVFTSWTTDRQVAEFFATKYGGPGVVLTKQFPSSRLVTSPDVADEAEVLVTGAVYNAKVEVVRRAS
jgi:hypothetical protein